jgi:hypothetical protein
MPGTRLWVMLRVMKVNTQLARAAEKLELVRLRRGIPGADEIEGYVLDIGAEWVLLSRFDPGVFLNGSEVVRRSDIVGAGKRPSRQFGRRALELHGEWPPTLPGWEVPLDDVGSLLFAVAERRPLLTIYVEADDPDACFIGAPVKVGRRKLSLVEVSPRAVWDAKPTKWPLEDITRIDFGSRYEQALYDVGGPLQGGDWT